MNARDIAKKAGFVVLWLTAGYFARSAIYHTVDTYLADTGLEAVLVPAHPPQDLTTLLEEARYDSRK